MRNGFKHLHLHLQEHTQKQRHTNNWEARNSEGYGYASAHRDARATISKGIVCVGSFDVEENSTPMAGESTGISTGIDSGIHSHQHRHRHRHRHTKT